MKEKPYILVTGGCGYIGSHVSCQLSEAGYSVIVLDNLSTGLKSALLHNERLIEGDLSNQNLLEEIFCTYKIEAVLHFAASIVVPDSVKDPIAYYLNNTANTMYLLKTMVEHNVRRVVFSSTAAVYGDSTEPVSEDSPTSPQSPYGRSKLMDEWILEDVARAHSLSYVILRYFNVAGADSKTRIGQSFPNATHLIKVACQTLLGQRPHLEIFGADYPTFDGTCIRDYIHVEDLAAAHLESLLYLEKGGESVTLNCGYNRGFSVLEVIKTFEQIAKEKLKTKMSPRRAGDVPTIVAKTEKIHKTLLNWKPRHNDLKKIILSALLWEKKLAKQE